VVVHDAGRAMTASTAQTKDDVPNWYDGPITMWAIVDRHGTPFTFNNERVASEMLTAWEDRLAKFGPYRLVKLVEQREAP
jgi:hypothetical protein